MNQKLNSVVSKLSISKKYQLAFEPIMNFSVFNRGKRIIKISTETEKFDIH